MRSIRCSIRGIPYGQSKPRGDRAALKTWSSAVIESTQSLPKVTRPCILRVTFLLPPNKFPDDHPFRNDLDNLLKRFCDAITTTILSEAQGNDGVIIALEAAKAKVDNQEDAGAELEIIEI